MRGEGFDPKVKVGDRVRTGDELIAFDLDKVATGAKDLLTQIVIANSDLLTSFTPRRPGAAGSTTSPRPPSTAVPRTARSTALPYRRAHRDLRRGRRPEPDGPARAARRRPVQARAEVREHSRAQAGRRPGERQERHGHHGPRGLPGTQGPGGRARPGRRPGSRRSPRRCGRGWGRRASSPSRRPRGPTSFPLRPRPVKPPDAPRTRTSYSVWRPRPASASGGSCGCTTRTSRSRRTPPTGTRSAACSTRPSTGHGPARGLENRLRQDADPDKAAIFAAHQGDPARPGPARHRLERDRQGQERGLRLAAGLHHLRGPARRPEERAARPARDGRARRRPARPGGGDRAAPREGGHPRGDDPHRRGPHPSDTASLDRTKVVGFCTLAGGASSHVAILARSLDIPAVAGIEPRALDIADGTLVILDGAKGTLRMNVTEDDVARIRARQERLAARRAEARARGRAGRHRRRAPRRGGRQHRRPRRRPGGDDQGRRGRRAAALGVRLPRPHEGADRGRAGRDLHGDREDTGPRSAARDPTLDVGGDKPLPYMPMAPEENPSSASGASASG